MNYQHLMASAASTCLLIFATAASAEDGRFNFEMELEIGVDSVFDSDDPTAELTDTYFKGEAALDFAISDRVTAFAGFTLESVTDPTGDRTFEDLGLYVNELGLSFDLGATTVDVGKIAPAFGTAWDVAPGYYGTSYAEDYELSEMIGVSAEFELGQGTLIASAFYADNTSLSNSWGTKRGRNSTSAGGAGNTGKLNNFALQYDVELGNTTVHAGARFLSMGTGDAKDETGLALGVTHAVNDDLEIMAELASFDGFGGTADDATFATIGASLTRGPVTYSAAYARRDLSSAAADDLITLGIDYEMKNGATLQAAYGFADEGGTEAHKLGLAVIIPIGG